MPFCSPSFMSMPAITRQSSRCAGSSSAQYTYAAADALNHNIRHNFYPFLPVFAYRHIAKCLDRALRRAFCSQKLYSVIRPSARRAFFQYTPCVPRSALTRGRRHSPASQPSTFMACFTGMGFTSQNSASASGSISSCSLRAFAVSPSKNALQQLCTSSGLTLDTTLITPFAAQSQQGEPPDRRCRNKCSALVAAQLCDLGYLRDVAGSFLDAVDQRMLAQFQSSLRGKCSGRCGKADG